MNFEPFRYMAWAKEHGQGRYRTSLAESGTRSVSKEELSLSIGDVALNGVDRYGPPELMDRLAEFLGVGASNVVRTSGTSLANFLAYGAILDRGDEALVETPVYEALTGLPQLFGASVRTFARGESRFEIDPDRVLAALSPRTRLVAVSNLHNPSGVAADDAALREIGREAERRGFYVLVDEVYQDFAGTERIATAYRRLGPRFLATNSLTKVYGMGGLRLGWIVADEAIARRAEKLMDYLSVVTAYPASMIAVVALRRIDALRERALRVARANVGIVRDFVRRNADRVRWVEPDGGIVAFLRFERGRNGDEVSERLRHDHDTLVVPGSFFGAPDGVRIGFGGSEETLRLGLANLEKVLLSAG
jgi:aspartate/methionine/tyrosine aminotransferase